MLSCIYAGSFDPWTLGHQFVLNSALKVFEQIHIVSAINPAKQSIFDAEIRTRLIAHAIDPFSSWWTEKPPYKVGKNVIITAEAGLVAAYAKEHKIGHLIRGLRSTTDFEAEFNLYFSNQAIHPELQTWAIMCPPRLLYCSSTYVKTVVGKQDIKFVGTKFVAQSLMLGWSRYVGHIFDLIETCSRYRFDGDSSNLNTTDLSECLQIFFTNLYQHCVKSLNFASESIKQENDNFDIFLKKNSDRLRKSVEVQNEYPQKDVSALWAILYHSLQNYFPKGTEKGISSFNSLAPALGKTAIKFFSEKEIIDNYKKI